jgi:hypothetical protein
MARIEKRRISHLGTFNIIPNIFTHPENKFTGLKATGIGWRLHFHVYQKNL